MFALTEDHRALAEVVQAFALEKNLKQHTREALDRPFARTPPHWPEMAALGWLGLHVPVEHGGEGYGLPELAIVLERLGAVPAAGPLLPTVLASATLVEAGDRLARERPHPALAGGTALGAVGLGGSVRYVGGRVEGDAGMVLGADVADVFLLRCGDDVLVMPRDSIAEIVPVDDVDSTRPSSRVRVSALRPDMVLAGAAATARRLAWVLAAAEAAGAARACTEMATAYAKQRFQFGRPIGSFQAVKHICANMIVDAELATAAAWDAARPASSADEAQLTAATAAVTAIAAMVRAAERNIQIHGGIGYTWEHEGHVFLRRALATRALFGSSFEAAQMVASLVEGGTRRELAVELPDVADTYRSDVRSFVAAYDTLPDDARRAHFVDSGYFMPHWPRPWGRQADAIEQLVIEQELDGRIESEELGITGWVTLTLVQHGSPEQQQRWVRPTLLGRTRWCQMFSEPDAGSDAAAISTRARRAEGGWLVNGQKVWTSDAANCDWGFATVVTDPGGAKHSRITMMAIDMSAPGVDIRPLRELTGGALFNEIFLTDVFVPDEDVVGSVNGGWTIARATLGNERVTIGARRNENRSATRLLELAATHRHGDPDVRREIGTLIAEELARRALGLRQATRAVHGAGPGPEGNVSKLLAGEHTQRTADLGLRIAAESIVGAGESELTQLYLFSRCLTIAGGTSEIVRNQIAEQILGLPRDPFRPQPAQPPT